MAPHWHAFAYTGYERPSDGQARDPESATPPHEVRIWFRKPASMRAGTFTDPGAAYGWLERELSRTPPMPASLPAAVHLTAADESLRRGADVYVGYYTAGGWFLVRTLLTCPRPGERCPDPPR